MQHQCGGRDRMFFCVHFSNYFIETYLQKHMLLHTVYMLKMTNVAPFVIIMQSDSYKSTFEKMLN